MSNKLFIGIIALLAAGVIGSIVISQSNSAPPQNRLGQEQPDFGREHLQPGQSAKYDSDFPTSGTHSPQPADWGAYKQEIPNENLIHSMEHGGIVITYRPDLDAATVSKIERLFTRPFSNPDFAPTKVVIVPYSKNDKPIVMRSWRRILNLDSFNEKTMMDYYLGNVNKSPEPAAS